MATAAACGSFAVCSLFVVVAIVYAGILFGPGLVVLVFSILFNLAIT